MYFETLSALPVYFYKKWINSKAEIFVHYHEYTSPEEYHSGMRLQRYFHQLERKLYCQYCWVSHTNQFRMDMFKEDIFPTKIREAMIIPNYPPKKWWIQPKQMLNWPLRIVHIGAFSIASMYVKEFAYWVVEQRGKVKWVIFTSHCTEESRRFILSLKTDWICLEDGVDYENIPMILKEYDVGVVLYKGVIKNHIFSVSNKLFEYLALGLDVWFPQEILGSLELIRENTYPKILALDFKNLQDFDLKAASERFGDANDNTFYCEDALKPLIDKLINNDR